MVIILFLKYLTGNKFALIHVSMIRMCNKIKIEASLFQKYLLWLVLRQNHAAETLGNHVFSSLNTLAEENVNIQVDTNTRVISTC